MSTEKVICQNCEQPYEDNFNFCPHCGQKSNDELTIGVLFYNTISNYFSFDARFLKSFFPLLFKPGYLAKEFIKGKRLLYLHPAQMYLFVSVVFFFLFSFTAREHSERINRELKKTIKSEKEVIIDSAKIKYNDSIKRVEIRKALESNKLLLGIDDKEIDSIITSNKLSEKNALDFDFNEKEVDSLINIDATDEEIYKAMGKKDDANWFMEKLYQQGLKFYKNRDGGTILAAFYDTIPLALFFLLPIFAVYLKIFFFRKGTYAHHLVFGFYFFSFLFTVLCIVFGFNLIKDIPDWIDWLVVLSTFFYLFIAIKKFYGQHWFWSFVKTCIISFFFFITTVLSSVILLAISFWYFY